MVISLRSSRNGNLRYIQIQRRFELSGYYLPGVHCIVYLVFELNDYAYEIHVVTHFLPFQMELETREYFLLVKDPNDATRWTELLQNRIAD